MEEITRGCCILAHTNSKGSGGKNGVYIYLTHIYTQTQYQVVEFSHCHLQCYGHKDETFAKAFMCLCNIKLTDQSNPLHWWTSSGLQKVPYSSSTLDSK